MASSSSPKQTSDEKATESSLSVGSTSFLPGGTGIVGRFLETNGFIGMRVLRVKPPLWMELAFVLWEWVQIVSFSVDPAFLGDELRGSPIWTIFTAISRTRSIFSPRAWEPVLFGITSGFCVVYCFSLVAAFVSVWRGGVGWKWFYFMIANILKGSHGLLLVIVYCLLSTVVTRQQVGLIAFAMFCLLITVSVLFHTTFFISHNYLPSFGPFSRFPVIDTFISYFPRILLAVCDVVIKDGWGASGTATTSTLVTYAIIVFAYSFLLFSKSLILVPFTVRKMAFAEHAVLTASLLASTLMLVSLAGSSKAWKLGCAIAILAGIVPACFGGLGLMWLRFRFLRLRLPFSARPADPSSSFPFVFSRDRKSILPSDIDRAEALLEEGLAMFPKSSALFLKYCIFLYDVRQNFSKLRQVLNQELSSGRRHPIGVSIVLHYLRNSIPRNKEITGDQETDLVAAESHFRGAHRALCTLWENLASNKQTGASSLLENIDELVQHERIAENVFHDILASPSAPVASMRLYAQFLEEIKDDKEQAEMVYDEADAQGEARASSKKKKASKKKGRVGLPAAPVFDLTGSQRAKQRDEEEGSGSEAGSEGSAEGSETRSQHSRTNSDGSATSSGHSSSNERSKLLDMKQRVQRKRSKWVRLALVTLLFLSLVSLGITMASFIVSINGVSSLDTSTIEVDSLTRTATAVFRVGSNLFSAGDNWTAEFNASAEGLNYLWFRTFNQSSEDVRNAWRSTKVKVAKFIANPNGTVVTRRENMTLWDAGIQFVSHSLQIASVGRGSSGSPDWLFVAENAPEVSSQIGLLADGLGEGSIDIRSSANGLMVAGFSALGGFFLAGILTINPLMYLIEKERRKVADLFRELPKSTCINVFEKVKKTSHNSQSDQMNDVLMASRFPVSIKLLFHSGLVVILFLSFSISTMLVFSQYTTTANKATFPDPKRADEAVLWLGKSSAGVEGINFDLQRLVFPRPEDNVTQIKERIATEVDEFLASRLSTASRISVLSSQEQLSLYYDTPCPASLLAVGIKCRGLDALLLGVVESADALVRAKDASSNHTAFAKAMAAFQIVREWVSESQEIEFDNVTGILTISRAVFISLLIASLIVWAPCLLWLASIFGTIDSVNGRAMGLLMMVPMKVLLKIDSIKAFLENDGQTMTTSTKEILDEQERRTKTILDASADSIIVMDERGVIETANPATVSLLGHQVAQLIGTRCTALMSAESATLFESSIEAVVRAAKKGKRKAVNLGKDSELTLVRMDGNRIPVLASTSTAITARGVTFAAFFRDIRRIKENEAALEQEKKRADLLLLNVLPQRISEALKSNPGQPIAQKFESCTVMFADVCGFTAMASGMESVEVVEMLNEIFGAWDKLCPAFRVEKIKTLGDCFMCATGIPTATTKHATQMIEFAMCALEELEKINTKRSESKKLPIAFRFGIHSGSGVIGGVIGARKWQFDIWGDVVQIAAKIETAGLPNRIQVSSETRALAKDKFAFESRGKLRLGASGNDLEVECFLLSEGQHAKRRLAGRCDTSSGIFASFSSSDMSSSFH